MHVLKLPLMEEMFYHEWFEAAKRACGISPPKRRKLILPRNYLRVSPIRITK